MMNIITRINGFRWLLILLVAGLITGGGFFAASRIREGEYDHVLRLRPEKEGEVETEGWHVLAVPYGKASKVQLVIHKMAINEIAKETPKLNYLKYTESEEQQQHQMGGKKV